jgi:hypothetical protein
MDIADIDFRDFEIEPPPANTTPREFVLYATGNDLAYLKDSVGRDYTWEELKSIGVDHHILRIIELSPRVSITLRRKSS